MWHHKVFPRFLYLTEILHHTVQTVTMNTAQCKNIIILISKLTWVYLAIPYITLNLLSAKIDTTDSWSLHDDYYIENCLEYPIVYSKPNSIM